MKYLIERNGILKPCFSLEDVFFVAGCSYDKKTGIVYKKGKPLNPSYNTNEWTYWEAIRDFTKNYLRKYINIYKVSKL